MKIEDMVNAMELAGIYPARKGQYVMTNKPKWITHNTNEMPKRLKDDTIVRYCMNDYVIAEWTAGNLAWNKTDKCWGIIAYQIVEE